MIAFAIGRLEFKRFGGEIEVYIENSPNLRVSKTPSSESNVGGGDEIVWGCFSRRGAERRRAQSKEYDCFRYWEIGV